MANYLVIRLSAIGDVAMTIPVIYSAARQNPKDSFTILTQDFLVALFINHPLNVKIIGVDLKGKEKKLPGLIQLANKLSRRNFDAILDLHNVLRSIVIRSVMSVRGKKVFALDKVRQERKKLTRRKNKELKPLRPVIDRYADVFYKAGIHFEINFTFLFERQTIETTTFSKLAVKTGNWIGIAPFAKHQGKVYPVEKMEEVIKSLSDRENTTIFLFGGKGKEATTLEEWATKYTHVINMVGRYSLSEEIAFMTQLDLLLSMDSANMHFASLVNTKVISIWGATHPYTGFYGFKQNPKDAIQLDLYCRPCSVFGDKPCYRGDMACMNGIMPEMILKIIDETLIPYNKTDLPCKKDMII